LIKRVELVSEWVTTPEQVAANFAVRFEDERRFRFVVGIIGRKKIGEQLPVFINGVNRLTEKSGHAA
jgi:hypothetical protein